MVMVVLLVVLVVVTMNKPQQQRQPVSEQGRPRSCPKAKFRDSDDEVCIGQNVSVVSLYSSPR